MNTKTNKTTNKENMTYRGRPNRPALIGLREQQRFCDNGDGGGGGGGHTYYCRRSKTKRQEKESEKIVLVPATSHAQWQIGATHLPMLDGGARAG